MISDFEAERGTPRTTWAGRGEEEEDAAATTKAMAEFFVVLGPLAFLLFLCWNDAAEAAAAMLCFRGEGTAAVTRGRTQRIVRKRKREKQERNTRLEEAK